MKTVLFILGLVLSTLSFSQDIHLSQFYMSPLQQNPSMAGAIYPLEANIAYKDQWRSVASPFRTVSLGYHMRFDKKRSSNGYLAAGVSFFNDKAGDANLGTGKGG